jgi:L-lysine exporter family protein LysE/ArgO
MFPAAFNVSSASAAVILHGVILSLGLILPLGVQNLFVFSQGAYHERLWRVAPVVITAALCDTLLISLSVAGVSVIVLAHLWLRLILMGAGSLFLFYMGWSTFSSASAGKSMKDMEAYTVKRQIAFAASVSLLNPHAIMDTMGVIGTSSLQYAGYDRLLFAVSCIAVSWFWFAALALSGRVLGRLDASGKGLALINKLSALFIWLVAAGLLYSVWQELSAG